jgi:hypothetical protein
MASVLGLMGLTASASAEDWTMPGAQCRTVAGIGAPNSTDGYTSGGVTVAICPFVKKVAVNNLTQAFVRVRRANTGTMLDCTVMAGDSLNGSATTSWVSAPNVVGNLSVSLPVPATVPSQGYLSAMCVLANGDVIRGVRMTQN